MEKGEKKYAYIKYIPRVDAACQPYSLVVEHYIGQPDVFGGNIQSIHTSVLSGCPRELFVQPFLHMP